MSYRRKLSKNEDGVRIPEMLHGLLHVDVGRRSSNSTPRESGPNRVLVDVGKSGGQLSKNAEASTAKECCNDTQHRSKCQSSKRKSSTGRSRLIPNARLYELTDPPDDRVLDEFENNPISALLNCAALSGVHRFHEFEDLLEIECYNEDTHEKAIQREDLLNRLTDLIRENCDQSNSNILVNNFQMKYDIKGKFVACASCGIWILMSSSIRYHDISVRCCENLKMIDTSCYYAVDEAVRHILNVIKYLSGEFYYLHPEFIDSTTEGDAGDVEERCRLCQECHVTVMNRQILQLSFAAGVDFGNPNRLNLPMFTLSEELLVARCRIYMNIVKLVGPSVSELKAGKKDMFAGELEGSYVEEGTAGVLMSTFLPEIRDLHQYLSVSFVGSRLQWEALLPYYGSKVEELQVQTDVVMVMVANVEEAQPLVYPWYQILTLLILGWKWSG